MKKTLAAVLAAAMALSTASVAFARDTLPAHPDPVEDNSHSWGFTKEVKYDQEYAFLLAADIYDPATGKDISIEELGEWLNDGIVTITPTITQNANKLASKPSVTLRGVTTSEKEVVTYKWANVDPISFGGKVVIKNGNAIKAIPVNSAGVVELTNGSIAELVYPQDDRWDALFAVLEAAEGGKFVAEASTSTKVNTEVPAVRVACKIADTWGTDSTTVKMKFRITFKKTPDEAVYSQGYKKGDTVITDEIAVKAVYEKMNDKGHEMELTQTEVSNREVLMNADKELYEKIGTDEFTVYFENTAAFTGKMAPNQKPLNLGYTLADQSDLVSDYLNDIDFEFIKFYGAEVGSTTFVNTGKLTFNAIGGEDTAVYEVTDEGLVELETSNYQKYANTIDVKGIKKLTNYVIATKAIPEEEEPEEPADNAPTVEPSEDDDNSNPNTGAC